MHIVRSLRVGVMSMTCVIAVIQGCRSSSVNQQPDEGLTDEELALLDAAPDAPFDPSKIAFEDGETVDDHLRSRGITLPLGQSISVRDLPAATTVEMRRRDVISLWITKAEQLMDRSQWQVSGQNGLAYSFGSHDTKLNTPAPSCTVPVQGLDCAGFVYQSVLASLLDLGWLDAAHEAQRDSWNKKIDDLGWGLEMDPVTDGSPPTIGDVIFWDGGPGHRHIGLVGTLPPTIVFQSNGTSGPPPATRICADNSGPRRGPRAVVLTDFAVFKGWFPNITPSLLRLRSKKCPDRADCNGWCCDTLADCYPSVFGMCIAHADAMGTPLSGDALNACYVACVNTQAPPDDYLFKANCSDSSARRGFCASGDCTAPGSTNFVRAPTQCDSDKSCTGQYYLECCANGTLEWAIPSSDPTCVANCNARSRCGPGQVATPSETNH